MASGNKVFRAKVTFFADKIKVPVGSLVREGHALLKDADHLFEELRIDFERDDLKAAKAAKAAADKAAADAEASAKGDAKDAVADVAEGVEAEAPAVEADAVKAVEADAVKVEKAAS